MADIVFNVAVGKVRYYAQQAGTGSNALIAVPLEAAGLVADDVMRDYATLADILAGASNEQTTLGRKTITVVSDTVNNTANRWEGDFDDLVWAAPSGNPVGAIVICFDSNTGTGTDADLVPLTKHDWAMTPEGDSIAATVIDFVRSASNA